MPTYRKLLEARRDEVFATLAQLHEFVDGCALSPRTRNAVEVAAEELLSNVWKYAYPPGEAGPAALLLETGPERVRLEVSDSGLPFDPTLVPPPPPPSLDTAPGGRGIHLVRGLSSSFAWRRDGDRNVVVVEFTVP
ncbi:MAG: ATP-binding protein [Holophagales bacterium]|nr:ATP-binding protein [Holophagales bacterium]